MEIDQSLSLKESTLGDRLLTNISAFLFFMMVFLVCIQVLVRELAVPISVWWAGSVASVLLIVSTFIGSAFVGHNNEHIQIGFFADMMEKRWKGSKRALDILNSTLILAFLTLLFLGLAQNAMGSWDTTFGTIRIISTGLVSSTLAIGVGIMIIDELSELLTNIQYFISSDVPFGGFKWK